MCRRDFLSLVPAGPLVPGGSLATRTHPFRIRTITAGVPLVLDGWEEQLQQTVTFLRDARAEYQQQDYEVQTLRIATQPLPDYLGDWLSQQGLQVIHELDVFCD